MAEHSVIRQELDIIESRLQSAATNLEGLANDGFGWAKPEADAEVRRYRDAVRENADRIRELAARLNHR